MVEGGHEHMSHEAVLCQACRKIGWWSEALVKDRHDHLVMKSLHLVAHMSALHVPEGCCLKVMVKIWDCFCRSDVFGECVSCLWPRRKLQRRQRRTWRQWAERLTDDPRDYD